MVLHSSYYPRGTRKIDLSGYASSHSSIIAIGLPDFPVVFLKGNECQRFVTDAPFKKVPYWASEQGQNRTVLHIENMVELVLRKAPKSLVVDIRVVSPDTAEFLFYKTASVGVDLWLMIPETGYAFDNDLAMKIALRST